MSAVMAVSDISWPEAAIAVAGIVFVTVVVAVAIAQVLGTVRARAAVTREGAYQRLAAQATEAQQATAERLEQVATDLANLRARTIEVERLLTEVG